MKRYMTLAFALALVVTIAVGGTFSYKTYATTDTNVFAESASLHVTQNCHAWNGSSYAVTTVKDVPLYPYVGELGWSIPDGLDSAWRRFTMNNAVDQYVTVANGTTSPDAYVRTIFAFEMGEYTSIEAYKYKILGYSYNAADGAEFDIPGWTWSDESMVTIDGCRYLLRTATYSAALEAGKETVPSLLQVYVNRDCSNRELAMLDGNGNGCLDIRILSQAATTDAGTTPDAALTAVFGAPAAMNGDPAVSPSPSTSGMEG